MLRVLDIVEGTSVDGPGLRTAIYLAGCTHHCPGCHNPESWAMDGGREATVDQIMATVEENGFNVTLTGGDPLLHPDRDSLMELCRRIRSVGYTIWLYTGFTMETLLAMPSMLPMLELVDVVVDGPYVESQRDTALRFRGSTNQRILDASASLAASRPVPLDL